MIATHLLPFPNTLQQASQASFPFSTHLVLPAEDVCIVLLEPPDSGQSRQGSAEFIAMEHTKVRHAQRELAVRTLAHRKHNTVTLMKG